LGRSCPLRHPSFLRSAATAVTSSIYWFRPYHTVAASTPRIFTNLPGCPYAAQNMSPSNEWNAVICDRWRLWEVRRYCQVRLALARNKFGGGESSREPQALGTALPDTILSSLLELLVDRLGADIAMVILLDEETQFFSARAGKDNSKPAVESRVARNQPFRVASWLRTGPGSITSFNSK
jgi:hypothetical protein